MEPNPEMPLVEPSLAILEIRIRMAQLDKIDEILEAVASMLKAVGSSSRNADFGNSKGASSPPEAIDNTPVIEAAN